MKIHGRDVRFLRTVKGVNDIASMCPGKNIEHIDAILQSDDTVQTQDVMARMLVALSEGYEYAKTFEEEGYKPRPLTLNEVMYLDHETFRNLFMEAVEALKGNQQTVEIEPSKKNEMTTESN